MIRREAEPSGFQGPHPSATAIKDLLHPSGTTRLSCFGGSFKCCLLFLGNEGCNWWIPHGQTYPKIHCTPVMNETTLTESPGITLLNPPTTSCQTGVQGLGGDGQTDGWKARRRRRQGMDGRKEERERCDPHSRAWSIYRRKCPNWQAAGKATVLHWYPTPCPSPPQPSLLLVFCLSPVTSSFSPFVPSSKYPSLSLLHIPDHLLIPRLPPLAPPPLTLHCLLQFLLFSVVLLFIFDPLLLTLVVSLHSPFSSNGFLLFSYTFLFVSPSHIKLKQVRVFRWHG